MIRSHHTPTHISAILLLLLPGLLVLLQQLM
jgi:hypothetical protein